MCFGIDLASLRRYAIARSHFPPTDLPGRWAAWDSCRPIRFALRRSASSGTTRCRHCGAPGVIGWGNVAVTDGAVSSEVGYVSGRPPRERAIGRALGEGLDRMREFFRAESAR